MLRLTLTETAKAMLIQDLSTIGPFANWTMDCKLTPASDSGTDAGSAAELAVGFSDNAIEAYDLAFDAGSLVRYIAVQFCPVHTL